jgi:hypothetical protein
MHDSRQQMLALSVLAIALLVGALLLVLPSLIAIPFAFEENYNEGWNVYNTQRFFTDAAVYDDNLWRVNNYPPVSFLMVGSLDHVVGNLLLSGRLVAALSFLAVGALAALTTLRRGAEPIDALFAGSCALGFCYLAAPAWVAVDDPQTLAQAVMLGGLVVYLGGHPRPARLIAAAVLIMLASFTKHNLIAIPLAVTCDLAIRARRELPLWLAACAGLAAAFWALTVLGAGGSFLAHLLEPRGFAWPSVEFHLFRFLGIFAAPIALTILFARRLFRGDRLVLAAYGIFAFASGALLSGFDGASYNMFQDAAVFLAIAAGLLLHQLRHAGGGAGVRLLIALLVSLPIAASIPSALAPPRRSLQAAADAERSFLADAAYVADRHGAAICESLLLCYFAGQPFWLDPFNSRQYILAGELDQTPLIARIAAHELSVVQLRAEISISHAPPPQFQRFTDELLRAVERDYRIDRRSPLGVFYLPK